MRPSAIPLFLCLTLLALTASVAWARFPAKLHVDHRYPSDVTYAELDDWDFISGIPYGVDTSKLSAYEKRVGSGIHVDTAWRWYTSGDPRIVIAVFDSGVKWDSRDIVNKHRLNAGELPPPQTDRTAPWPGVDSPGDATDCTQANWSQGGAEYDVNHDGVFNIKDYRCDTRVNPQDGQDQADDLLDPSDLIHARQVAFTDRSLLDDDGNGYVDDIAGWDFMWNDNDPYDDTRYSHGTGEANGSAGEADNDEGGAGACPDCMLVNVRVSDSYVADSNALAQGIVFAVDTSARVVQSALGTLTGSVFAQAAVDYAYERNVVAVMSAADETSMHHFPVSSGEHTTMVHAVVPDIEPDDMRDTAPTTFMHFSNCTNYGAHLFLSTPSTTCSSGAVKSTAGVAGLLYSYAVQNGLEPLTANEVQQLLRAGADDINRPGAAQEKDFPSQAGWDQHFGYGRTNAEAPLALMKRGKIPPEADIDSPRWFTVIDPARTPQVTITGLAKAKRAGGTFTWKLTYAPGVEPKSDDFKNTIAQGSSAAAVRSFGEWDLTQVAFDAAADYGEITSANSRGKVDQFTFTLRLQVIDAGGLIGEFRKVVYLRKDPAMLPGFPIDLGNSGEGSPKLADIDGDGLWDIVVGLADGTVRAFDHRGRMLRGWPVTTPLVDSRPQGANKDMHAAVVATPAIGKLDGQHTAVVVATLEGDVIAYADDGRVLSGWPQRIDAVHGSDTNPVQILDDGYFASPVLYDLQGDGTLEVIAAGMDGKLYVYDYQGKRVRGFPVEVRDAGVTDPVDLIEGTTSEECAAVWQQLQANRFKGGGYRSRIMGSPAVGDIDGDGSPDIVLGSGEIYPGFCESDHVGVSEGDTRLYAYKADGSLIAGYPIVVFSQTNILPFVGRGLPMSPVLTDLNRDGKSDLVYHKVAQLGGLAVLDYAGKSLLAFEQAGVGAKSNFASGGVFRGKPFPLLINYGSFGDMTGDGVPDFFVGAVSSDMLVSLENDGARRDADHLLLGFNGKTGGALPGFPRVMEDIQFFMNPSIADLDGDGRPEVLNGSGGFILHAWNANGARPTGWPKFTGQWLIASPAIGDIDGDGFLEVVVNTRDGFLFAWNTAGPTQTHGQNSVKWASFRHDNANTGNADAKLPLQAGPEANGGGCACDQGRGSPGSSGVLFVLGMLGLRLWLRRRVTSSR